MDKENSHTGNLQLGAGAGTRNFKKAVDRNRIRRLIREAWRLQKRSLEETIPAEKILAVFILYTSKEMPVYAAISEGVKKTIDKLSAIIHESR